MTTEKIAHVRPFDIYACPVTEKHAGRRGWNLINVNRPQSWALFVVEHFTQSGNPVLVCSCPRGGEKYYANGCAHTRAVKEAIAPMKRLDWEALKHRAEGAGIIRKDMNLLTSTKLGRRLLEGED